MIDAKKNIFSKLGYLSKYSGHIEGKRSSGSTKSAMINTQGNTLQGRATREKKNMQERTREVGGKYKKHPQTEKKKKRKRKI